MERLYPEIVITGCGNPLYADDGFGPAVVESLRALSLPASVKVIDTGLGGPHFVFTMLDPSQTKKLVVVDIASRTEVARLALPGQPDSVARSKDGRYVAVVIENERDAELAVEDQSVDVTDLRLAYVPAGADCEAAGGYSPNRSRIRRSSASYALVWMVVCASTRERL